LLRRPPQLRLLGHDEAPACVRTPLATCADDGAASPRPQFLNFTAPLGQVVGDELVAPLSQVGT